uniref:Uncharacterized protein n=1 Tax=Pyrodinium bahamense TaxID=73915 RepID=A0A7R9ZVM6_9DINO
MGSARSLHLPQVHQSIRRQIVDSVRAGYLRVFFVLNLTASSCTYCEDSLQQQHDLERLLPAIQAIGADKVASLTFEPECCWPKLKDNLSYSDCFADNWACPPQWRSREICDENVREYERIFGVSFDWILQIRPDQQWLFPLGDLRRFQPNLLYMGWYSFTELSDHYSLVPRALMPTLTTIFRTESGDYICLTTDEVLELRRAGRCAFGSCGCWLQLQLRRLGVPLGRFPREIAATLRLKSSGDSELEYWDASLLVS